MSDAAVTRVVIRLDAVSDSRGTIDAATRLALRWHARLHGVFVEDEALMQLAELPFARQIGLRSGHQALDAAAMRDEFKALARHARQMLAEAAQPRRLDWSFEVIRGAADAPIATAGPGDFIVMQAAARPFAKLRLPVRRPAPRAVRQPTLMLRRAAHRPGSVVAVVSGAPGDALERALGLAADLAAAEAASLTVLDYSRAPGSQAIEGWASRRAPGSPQLRIERPPPGSERAHGRRALASCCVLAVAARDADAMLAADADDGYD